MPERILSVFIDESGDFGAYEHHAPFYLVTMVLHDQQVDLRESIADLRRHVREIGYEPHAIHTGPLIRRESIYTDRMMEERKKLFHALYHCARKLSFQYICVKVDKHECPDVVTLTSRVSGAIAGALRSASAFCEKFDRIILYYDNGQVELTRILTAVFSTLYVNVEYRKVKPIDYMLFQVADLVCTLELLYIKAEHNQFSRSERDFFGTPKDFRKNYYRQIALKKHT